jgi:hypothetical protein
MGKDPNPSSISRKARSQPLRPKRRSGVLHGEGTMHRGRSARRRPKKPQKADHIGNASHADGSSHRAKPRSDTDALSPKKQAESLGQSQARVNPKPLPTRTSWGPLDPPLLLPPISHHKPLTLLLLLSPLRPLPMHARHLEVVPQGQWPGDSGRYKRTRQVLPPGDRSVLTPRRKSMRGKSLWIQFVIVDRSIVLST